MAAQPDMTWASLMLCVSKAHRTLTSDVIKKLVDLPDEAPGEGYGESEYLLPVDGNGYPVPFATDVVDTVQAYVEATGRGCWLRPVVIPKDSGAVKTLLVMRWLHHRIGLRHQTVQLILDHPSQPAITFMQVRGLDKTEAPGAFDLPCAGHVVGLDSALATLEKELQEELGLTLDDLDDLRQVGDYEYPPPSTTPDPYAGFYNVEYRTVYRARLKADGIEAVRIADQEVAALALVARATLPELAARFPERVASGLSGTLPWYKS